MTSMTELLRTDRLLDDLADRRAALSGSDPLARALLALAEDVDGPPEKSRATRAPQRTAARRPAGPVAGSRRPRGRSRWLGGGALAAVLVAGSSFAAAVTEVDRPGWGAAETPGTRSVAAHGQPSPAPLTTPGSWPLLPPVPDAVAPPPSSGSVDSPAELGLLLGLNERPGQPLDPSAAPARGTPERPVRNALAPNAAGDGQAEPAVRNGPADEPPGATAGSSGVAPTEPAAPGGGLPGVPSGLMPPAQAPPDAGAMARPATPADPWGPGESATPAVPADPGAPATPADPRGPGESATPAVPADPGAPATPADPGPGGPGRGSNQLPPEQATGTSAEPATPDRPGPPPAPPGSPADPPEEASDGDLP